MSFLIDQNIRKISAPALPSPPPQYQRTHGEQVNNILRLYFNQLDNILRSITATRAPTVSILAYRAVTATTTVTLADFLINCTSGTFSVDLPTAVGIAGQEFEIKNSGDGTITVTPSGAQTIDGSATKALIQYDAMKIMSDGANWIIV